MSLPGKALRADKTFLRTTLQTLIRFKRTVRTNELRVDDALEHPFLPMEGGFSGT